MTSLTKISGAVDKIVVPAGRSVGDIIDEGKRDAIARFVDAGGCATSGEIVEAYEPDATVSAHSLKLRNGKSQVRNVVNQDLNAYTPDIQEDVWNLSETDIDFLISGTGVLGVGCIGEATNYEVALKTALRDGRAIRIVSPEIVPPDDDICSGLWIGAPTIFLERLPGLKELPDAIYAHLSEISQSDFSYTVPSEIGGPNALDALLLASQLGKAAIDADLMGRAFPRAYMPVFGIQGIKLTPAAMSGGNGNIIELKDAKDDF
ncbi:hypothetical protein EDB80DRAFT_868895 [Ilyonectria destructans]|nr:hypothetical protein EDB80DRAFT_868895 [Ilyonectria destructans]